MSIFCEIHIGMAIGGYDYQCICITEYELPFPLSQIMPAEWKQLGSFQDHHRITLAILSIHRGCYQQRVTRLIRLVKLAIVLDDEAIKVTVFKSWSGQRIFLVQPVVLLLTFCSWFTKYTICPKFFLPFWVGICSFVCVVDRGGVWDVKKIKYLYYS